MDTSNPFIIPHTIPLTSPKIIANIVGIPAFIAIPIITPEKATMEPTDKSIPPVIITNVIPIAIIPIIAVCKAIVMKFVIEKN